MRTSNRLLSLSLLALPLVACSEAEHGQNNVVDFIPEQCGQAYCTLDDSLAVDGTIEVSLDRASDHGPVTDLRIESADPSVAAVVAIDDGVYPKVTLAGMAPGSTELLAIDGSGAVVDWLPIRVEAADRLTVDVLGSVDGPHAAVGYDDLYFASANTRIDVDVSAFAFGDSLTGAMQYQVVIDPVMYAAIDRGDDLASGHFHATLPPGEHTIAIGSGQAYRTVHFSVK